MSQVLVVQSKIHIILVTNVLCHTKRWFSLTKFNFCGSTKSLPKTFGPSQKFLGPVKGQGIQFQQLKLIKSLEIWKRKWLKKECTLYKRVMIRSALNFWKWKWKSERTHIFANEWELSEAQKIDERWTRWL